MRLLAVVSLLAACLIYLLFRKATLASAFLGIPEVNLFAPYWVKFWLPDFLFAFAAALLLRDIWKERSTVPLIGLLLFLAAGELLFGVFDWFDLLAYSLAVLAVFSNQNFFQNAKTPFNIRTFRIRGRRDSGHKRTKNRSPEGGQS